MPQGSPQASHEGSDHQSVLNLGKVLGALVRHHAAQIDQLNRDQCSVAGLASRVDRQPQHQPEQAHEGTGHVVLSPVNQHGQAKQNVAGELQALALSLDPSPG